MNTRKSECLQMPRVWVGCSRVDAGQHLSSRHCLGHGACWLQMNPHVRTTRPAPTYWPDLKHTGKLRNSWLGVIYMHMVSGWLVQKHRKYRWCVNAARCLALVATRNTANTYHTNQTKCSQPLEPAAALGRRHTYNDKRLTDGNRK